MPILCYRSQLMPILYSTICESMEDILASAIPSHMPTRHTFFAFCFEQVLGCVFCTRLLPPSRAFGDQQRSKLSCFRSLQRMFFHVCHVLRYLEGPTTYAAVARIVAPWSSTHFEPKKCEKIPSRIFIHLSCSPSQPTKAMYSRCPVSTSQFPASYGKLQKNLGIVAMHIDFPYKRPQGQIASHTSAC